MDKYLRRILFSVRSHRTNTFKCLQTMASQVPHRVPQESYEDAIKHLNTLQSNAQARVEAAAKRFANKSDIIPKARRSMELAGVSQQWLDTLNVIHVAGTKGKGTTCAFTESILRNAGLKTGFFSSPHLVEVRERIKIDGKPISYEKFAHYFFQVYNRLAPHEPETKIPPYFCFLTHVAFYAFLCEKVDVAIIEVGIGGTYDTTNVVSPTVVGITSLGLDHQPMLGYTMEEIAMHKAGIMKRGVPAFTVYNHENHILDLLQSHAASVKCPLYVVPNLDKFRSEIQLSVDDGNVSRINAALAVQLANSFLTQKRPEILKKFQDFSWENNGISTTLLPFHFQGLESAEWKGRFQVLQRSRSLQYFLDGAHTRESVSVALEWFRNTCSSNSFRVLIFNLTGERECTEFLKQFSSADIFNLVIFCPIQRRRHGESSDNWSAVPEGDISKSHDHCKQWESMGSGVKSVVIEDVDTVIEFLDKLTHKRKEMSPIPVDTNGSNCDTCEVLVTGSLHLVGSFLSVLDPHLND